MNGEPTTRAHDVRFDVPFYTLAEAAKHLDMAPSTLRFWVVKRQLVRSLPAETSGAATLPFMALAEAQFIRRLRKVGLSLQAVAEGIMTLRDELGPDYLLEGQLAHNGRDVLVRLADRDSEWERARDQQKGIPGVIELGLDTITFDEAGIPQQIRLDFYDGAEVIIDPRFAFGQPVLDNRGVRVEDLAQMFFAGESVDVVADEYRVTRQDVEAVVRVYGRTRAA